MKSQLAAALVIEGNLTGSPVFKLPRIAEELGPIKSGSLRIARRVSNFLQAGYAVGTYEELQAARLVLLRLPDFSVERVVAEVCTSELKFEDLAFVICDSWLTTESLDPLRAKGAAGATMCKIHTGQQSVCFAIEGQAGATRPLRRLLDRCDAQSIELRPGTKELLFTAELLTTALPMPLFVAAQQALRACGIAGNPLASVLEGNVHEMFRAFSAGARTTWGGPLTQCSPEIAQEHLAAVREKLPEIADLVDQQLPSARDMMTRPRQESSLKQQPSQVAETAV
jgi:hypothetical protein